MEKIMELIKTYTDVEIISKLFHARTQIHIFHLETIGTGSYAGHKALNEFYDFIVGAADTLAETLQGKNKAILKGYKSYPFVEDNNPVKFLDDLKYCLESYRNKLKKPAFDNIDNQIQVLIDMIEQTTYKLLFLK